MEMIIAILLLLVLARAFGELLEHLRQPAMVGEIIVGIMLGPAVFSVVEPTLELKAIADISIFFLVFLAGFELRPEDIKKAINEGSIFIGLLGFLIPLVLGVTVAILFGLDTMSAGFIGICISITAMPVTVRVLMDLKHLNTPLGQKIVSAIVLDDIMALTLLGIFLSASGSTEPLEIVISGGWIILKVFLFIGLIICVNRLLRYRRGKVYMFPRWFDIALTKLKCRENLFAINVLIVLIFAVIAQIFGLHFIVGTFFGSLIITKEIIGEKHFSQVKTVASAVTFGFLAPIFFAYIGLEFSFQSFEIPLFLIGIISIAIGGKLVGGFVGGKIAGLNERDSLTVGVAINGRGIVELVIATLGLKAGLISTKIFSALVLMGIITTIITPLLLKWKLKKRGLNKRNPSAAKR